MCPRFCCWPVKEWPISVVWCSESGLRDVFPKPLPLNTLWQHSVFIKISNVKIGFLSGWQDVEMGGEGSPRPVVMTFSSVYCNQIRKDGFQAGAEPKEKAVPFVQENGHLYEGSTTAGARGGTCVPRKNARCRIRDAFSGQRKGPRFKLGSEQGQKYMERETGFEPATSTLARLHSTTELLPQNEEVYRTIV